MAGAFGFGDALAPGEALLDGTVVAAVVDVDPVAVGPALAVACVDGAFMGPDALATDVPLGGGPVVAAVVDVDPVAANGFPDGASLDDPAVEGCPLADAPAPSMTCTEDAEVVDHVIVGSGLGHFARRLQINARMEMDASLAGCSWLTVFGGGFVATAGCGIWKWASGC